MCGIREEYRAKDLLVAFDPLHLRGHRHWGSNSQPLSVQHLCGNREVGFVWFGLWGVHKEKKNRKGGGWGKERERERKRNLIQ